MGRQDDWGYGLRLALLGIHGTLGTMMKNDWEGGMIWSFVESKGQGVLG